MVIWNMMNVNEKAHGYPALVQDLTLDSCPLPAEDPEPPSFYARILPLGASIVWGVGSSNGNGFRKPLRDRLRQAGWEHVNIVGSQNNGNMVDSVSVDGTLAIRDTELNYKPERRGPLG